IRYNKPQSPNVVKSWASHWDELPECELKIIAYHSIKAFLEDIGEAFAKAFNEVIKKPYEKTIPNQEQEQNQEQDQKQKINEAKASTGVIPQNDTTNIQTIFTYWQNIMNHPRAKLDNNRLKKIIGALKLGYTVEQLKQ